MKKITHIMLSIISIISIANNLEAKYITYKKKAPATETNRQIKQDTKALEQKLNEIKRAKNNAAKENAQQDAYQAAQALMVDLNEERSLLNDVYSGYTPTQIKKARIALAKLYPMQKKVADAITKKENDLAKITDKGFFWNAALPGKEKEYDAISLEITKLKNASQRLDRIIRNHKVIAGDEWSNAYRALVSAGVIATTAAGIDLILYGGAGTSMALSKASALAGSIGPKATAAGAWLTEKGITSWEWTKWVAQYGFAAASALLTLDKYYKNAESAYLIAEQAYKQLSPTAAPQERARTENNLKEAEANYKAAKAKYDQELARLQMRKKAKNA
jgi:hypothetical protein